MMLQQEKPDDYVIATNETHSVREFVEASFATIGVSITWKGEGVDEVGISSKTGQEVVRVDPRYFRPTEVENLWGDSSKAQKILGWKPEVTFKDLVKEMTENDREFVRLGKDHL